MSASSRARKLCSSSRGRLPTAAARRLNTAAESALAPAILAALMARRVSADPAKLLARNANARYGAA
jgi:hypothetical protein